MIFCLFSISSIKKSIQSHLPWTKMYIKEYNNKINQSRENLRKIASESLKQINEVTEKQKNEDLKANSEEKTPYSRKMYAGAKSVYEAILSALDKDIMRQDIIDDNLMPAEPKTRSYDVSDFKEKSKKTNLISAKKILEKISKDIENRENDFKDLNDDDLSSALNAIKSIKLQINKEKDIFRF